MTAQTETGSSGALSAAELGFDPDALRKKYEYERDKRLRQEGNEQYVEVKDEFEHYIDDPYTEFVAREPLTDEVEVLVIGGGFGGLLAGARLREQGFQNIRMLEAGGDFGGTWYWNRYPGAQCDIESYVYLPLLEETGYMPIEKYAHAKEIMDYSQLIARHYDLYRDVCFHTTVKDMHWDDDAGRWIINTNQGDAMRAQYVVMANGPLNRPKLPGIPGVGDFKGHSFHTSRWDYDYTGGDSYGNLNKLRDKRVAIIGTGATAVQCIPHLGEGAQHLYVFQRTPSSIDVRGNHPTDENWFKSLEPGWHQYRMDNFDTLTSGGYTEEDLVNDGWTEILRNLIFLVKEKKADIASMEGLETAMEIADFQKMNQIRARVDELVKDPEIAEKLKPWYRQFCKRPCFADNYLPTFNRENVTLIDTDGKGVERITEEGVVFDGVEYEVDCLVFATGFEVGTDYTRRAGYDVHGKNGQTLSGKWKDGMRSLHGMHVHDFPNMFIMSVGQSAFSANYPHALNEQAKLAAYILKHATSHQVRTVEATTEAEDEWVETIKNMAVLRDKFLESCTPGYYNNEGQPGSRSRQDASYGGGPQAFYKLVKDWADEGSLKGLELNS